MKQSAVQSPPGDALDTAEAGRERASPADRAPGPGVAHGDYEEYLARGRKRRQAGRPVDAMLCYRAALRLDVRSAPAHLELGELLHGLGGEEAARAQWGLGLQANPDNLPLLLRAARASYQAGHYEEAVKAYRHAEALQPQDPAPALALALLRIAQGDAAGYSALQAGLARGAPFALWEELARTLSAAPRSPGRAGLLRHIAAMPAAASPPLLLACAAEELAAAGEIDAARALLARAPLRAAALDDPETLRWLALAAARAGTPSAWAQRYAERCVSMAADSMPSLWPRRTAGSALRVVYLVDARGTLPLGNMTLDTDTYLRAVVASHPSETVAATLFVVGELNPATRAALGHAVPVAPLGDALPGALARALAGADGDALIDLIGLGAAVGPLLAQRPARTVWTYPELAWANVAPLVSHRLPLPEGGDAAALSQHRATLEQVLFENCAHAPWFADASPRSAAELGAAWRAAVAAHQSGDFERARALYEQVLAEQPAHAAGQYLLGRLLSERGQSAAAGRALGAAVGAAPRNAQARVALADLLIQNRSPQQAAAVCEAGLRQAPDEASLWRALGLARLAERDGRAAQKAFRAALKLAPTHALSHYHEAVALQLRGKRRAALRAYERAATLEPQLTAAEFNSGVIWRELHRAEEAIAAFERVLARDPRHVPAHKALAATLQDERRLDAWLQAFDRFEQACPNALPLLVMALEACQYRGDFARLEHYLDRLRHDQFKPSSAGELADCLEELLFLLLYFDVEPELQLGLYKAYDRAAASVYGTPLAPPATRRPGRIRIGYLSGDLRNHVMGKMMYAALEHHDRRRFELFFYSLSAESDSWTQRYRALGDRFEVIAGLAESEAAKRIAAADLDILVDLGSHTRGAKPGILALKPARVQITHIASAGAVGLSTIDFKLTDAYADLPECAAQQIEAPLPMAGCVYPYRHVAPAAEHPFRRDLLGIATDAIVIGAFVHPLKLSRRCLALWREVLERLPGAVLAISPLSPERGVVYSRLFAAAGVSDARVRVIAQGRNDAENQARYALVDYTLDTLPYGGVNGTLEALDMNVPVVTLVGRKHGERSAYTILANLGVRQTMATSARDYVNIAVRLATEPAFMAEVRAAIRAGMARSPLTDMPQHTRHLEQAYVEALRERSPAALAASEDG